MGNINYKTMQLAEKYFKNIKLKLKLQKFQTTLSSV